MYLEGERSLLRVIERKELVIASIALLKEVKKFMVDATDDHRCCSCNLRCAVVDEAG